MKLLINTCLENKLIFAFKDGEKIIKREMGFRRQAENILKLLDKFLSEHDFYSKDIKKIVVISGPGKFTSLRVGISVANALAFALGVPVIGISSDKSKNIEEIFFFCELTLKCVSFSQDYVVPFYGKEPNITL